MILDYLQYIYNSYGLLRPGIELLLISFVVYSVMRFLRGTGGENLFKGLVLVLLGFWCVSFLTRWLGLERIGHLYSYFLVMILAVTLVSFQPELRRGLMRLGETTFARNGTTSEMQEVIEQVVDAVSQLSKAEIGAVIAFEREVGMADLIYSGVRLDARVSAAALCTIFWPGSPLHDLGVVINRLGRIAAAAVQFPLAEYGDYDRILGSRHRSAIGLSQKTDAVVVVVSEETGNISLAVNGKLTRFLTLEQLRQQLIDLLIKQTDRKKISADKIKADKAKANQNPNKHITEQQQEGN